MSDQNAPAALSPSAPAAPMNTLAIIAFVLSFFVSIAGVICGHLALRQIATTGESGREFALAGLIIGYVLTAIGLLAVVVTVVMMVVYLVFFGVMFTTIADYPR
ncbi:DUF4190 domain-containing protein [Pseudolysinimonas sp.]